MELLIISAVIAIVYFPIVWLAGKLGGEKLQTVAIFLMVFGSMLLMVAIPVALFCFLRFVLPLL